MSAAGILPRTRLIRIDKTRTNRELVSRHVECSKMCGDTGERREGGKLVAGEIESEEAGTGAGETERIRLELKTRWTQENKKGTLLLERLSEVRVLEEVTGKSGKRSSSSTLDRLMAACHTFCRRRGLLTTLGGSSRERSPTVTGKEKDNEE